MIVNRGFWRDGMPEVSAPDRIASEIHEVFVAVEEWRRFAPAEKTTDGYLELCSIPITLACWGWSVSVSPHVRGVKIRASKALAGEAIAATVTGLDLPDALWCLGQKLQQAMKGEGRPKRTRIVKQKKVKVAA